MPVTSNPALANSTASGSPTYPNPTIPTFALWLRILSSSACCIVSPGTIRLSEVERATSYNLCGTGQIDLSFRPNFQRAGRCADGYGAGDQTQAEARRGRARGSCAGAHGFARAP